MFQLYLLIGAFAGMTSGLFGVGGGTVVVPALAATFLYSGLIPASNVMQMSIGTSLAAMIFTTLSACYAYYRRGKVKGGQVKKIIPHLLIGVVVGALLAYVLPSHFLKLFFAFFLALFSLRLLFAKPDTTPTQAFLSDKIVSWIAKLIGVLCSLLGIGGGVMLVPLFLRLNLDMKEALGTSLACGVLISLSATVCFMLTGSVSLVSIPQSTGYIYWPAFLGIVISSMLFAPIGTLLAHRLPTILLKRLFAVFLFIMAIDMLFFSR